MQRNPIKIGYIINQLAFFEGHYPIQDMTSEVNKVLFTALKNNIVGLGTVDGFDRIINEEIVDRIKNYLLQAYDNIQKNGAEGNAFNELLDGLAKGVFGISMQEIKLEADFETMEVQYTQSKPSADLGDNTTYAKFMHIINKLKELQEINPKRFPKEIGEKQKSKKSSKNAANLVELISELEKFKLAYSKEHGAYSALNLNMQNSELAKKVIDLFEKHYKEAQGVSPSSFYAGISGHGEFKEFLLKVAKEVLAPYLSQNANSYKEMSRVIKEARENLLTITKDQGNDPTQGMRQGRP